MTKDHLSKSKLEKTELKIGFIPIVCSAPLIYAHSHGFFKKNGLNVELISAPGWSAIKQLMVYCDLDAAHMLSPMPLACSLGIDGKKADIRLATVQNVNGQALTLAIKHLGIKDVRDMRGFTFGVPYRFSMHYYLLCYFLAAHGVNPLKEVNIKEVAPPRMPFYLKKGWVDGVFAPEPFNQIPVHRNIGFIYILSKDIWQGHPCCSFATTQNFIDRYPNTYKMLLRSVLEAELALHMADSEQRKIIAREISDPKHLNQEDTVPVEQALTGEFPDGKGGQHTIPDRIDFIPYNWAEYGSWILSQMQRWTQLPGKVDYREVVESVFQTRDTFEFAEALGFAREDKPSLKGMSPFTGKDPVAYMINQPYCAFKEKRKPLRGIELSKEARDHLSEIIKHMVYMAGGKREVEMEITTEDEIGQLQQIFNEMILNMKFVDEALIEKNEELQKELSERKKAEEKLQKQTHDLDERVKELNCLYSLSQLVENPDIFMEEMLQGICDLIPPAWQYPETICARIILEDKTYKTNNFKETIWKQACDIIVNANQIGTIEVCCLEERPERDEGHFLNEEKSLINDIASRLGNIIEHKRSENQINQQNKFTNNIVEALSHPFYVVDANDYRIELANSATNGGSLTEKSFCFTVTHKRNTPCEGPEHICPLEEVKRLKKPVTVEHIHCDKEGNARNVEVHGSPIFDMEGNVVQMIEYSFDITERKQTETKIRKTKEHLDNIIESSLDCIVIGDSTGHVTRANKSFLKLIDYEEEEVIGKHISEFTPLEEGKYTSTAGELVEINGEYLNDAKEMTGKMFEEGRISNWESYYLLKNKKIVPVEMNIVLLYDSEGNSTGSVGINRDVTERKKIEIENARLLKKTKSTLEELKQTQSYLLQSEKMASIGQLAAGVAHEINNPTGFIHSNLGSLNKYSMRVLELIKKYEEGMALIKDNGNKELDSFSEEVDELKKKLKIDFIIKDFQKVISDSLEGTDRIKKIVGDLKSFSRIDQAEFKNANINEGIESTLNVIWNELKYKCSVEKDYGDLPKIYCNLGQLNQVFMNILVNGAQAIEEKGTITISTRHVNGQESSATNNNGEGCVEIKIGDTGSGIAEDKLKRVFEPFFTTKPVGKGTGLGLSIVYDIIQKHKGEIMVESEVEKGTVFTIQLPVLEGDKGAESMEHSAKGRRQRA